MRISTVHQSRTIDEKAQRDFRIAGETLMEAAGALSAREIEQTYYPEFQSGQIAIFCGPGNNGADGLVVARHLKSMGSRKLVIYIAAPKEKRSQLFELQLRRCKSLKIKIVDLMTSRQELTKMLAEIGKFRLLVDALFGIGLRSQVEGPYSVVIDAMNSSRRPIVSLDTPSGLEADRGIVCGRAIRADQTLTFGLAKPGFFVNEGPAHVGRLRILPIGFPRQLFSSVANTHVALTESMVAKMFPVRSATSNKTKQGHAMIFAGRTGMWGAGLLASGAAYRMGAGYVTLASFEDSTPVLASNPEILTGLADDESLFANDRWSVAAVGPGLGTGKETAELLARLRDRSHSKKLSSLVVDADALTVASRFDLFPFPSSWILTPHAGELSRIIGVDSKEIESDRFRYAQMAAKQTGCIVVLKGFRTVISDGERQIVVLSGNSALAKAGTGDVLTGMITGLLAQGLPPLRAAAVGAYLHGRLADEWVRSGNSSSSLQASDLRDLLPGLIGRITAQTVGRITNG